MKLIYVNLYFQLFNVLVKYIFYNYGVGTYLTIINTVKKRHGDAKPMLKEYRDERKEDVILCVCEADSEGRGWLQGYVRV